MNCKKLATGSALGALLATSFVGGGCGNDKSSTPISTANQIPKAEVRPGEEASLFPLEVGNQWVYVKSTQMSGPKGIASNSGEVTFRVASSKRSGAETRAMLELVEKGKITARQEWVVNSKGIFQATSGVNASPLRPIQPAIVFPIKEGQPFTWSGTGTRVSGTQGTSNMTSVVRGPQEVDTEMGRMSGISVESSSAWSEKGKRYLGQNVSWWKPKVGLVRYVQTLDSETGIRGVLTLSLKSSSLKGRR